MNVNTLTVTDRAYPSELRQLAQVPAQLYVRGELAGLLDKPRVAVVGSRNVTTYGREVTTKLTRELTEQGVVIVSGLALGVDSIAHAAALEAGGQTIAVLPGSVRKPYPASHRQLADRIVEQGGALISEYTDETIAFKSNFIARNRIIAALSHALVVTEAAEKSGSLHTANFALEIGRDVLSVPGSIYSPTSAGTNNLIKMGAAPVTGAADILQVLGLLNPRKKQVSLLPVGSTSHEQIIIDLLQAGITDGAMLLTRSNLSVTTYNQALTMLEISGKVRALGANHWSLR